MSRKISGIVADSTELRKLMAEHPDYPICVLVGEDANVGDYGWMYCSDIRFGVGEILDCDQPVDDERVYHDRNSFEEELENWLWDEMCDEAENKDTYVKPTEEEFQKRLAEEMAKYEPYWKDCIFIYADN